MKALGLVLLGILTTVLNGFVLTVLWRWFVVETFGLKSLTIPQALGIALVIGFLTSHYSGEDKRSILEKAIYVVLAPLFFLAIGFVYHLFM